MMQRIKKRFKSKTSKTVQFLQITLSAIATVALYYAGLPDKWQTMIPDTIIKVVAITGFALSFLLQFTKKKTA